MSTVSIISSVFEWLGFGDVSGIDIIFAGMAIVGTLLFILYFGLVLIGGAADGALDMLGFDLDFGMDSTQGAFHMLTIQGLLSFMMMFGIFGLAASQADQSSLMAIGAGSVAGLASMWIVGKIFQMVAGLESDGNIKLNEAIGAKGTVYRTIKPGQSGQVQVEFQSALRTCEAVAEDETLQIDTGKFITVVGNISEMLIVKPLKVSSAVHYEEE